MTDSEFHLHVRTVYDDTSEHLRLLTRHLGKDAAHARCKGMLQAITEALVEQHGPRTAFNLLTYHADQCAEELLAKD
jgi:hypothetical protein